MKFLPACERVFTIVEKSLTDIADNPVKPVSAANNVS
jgi:hypothetical protein